jgi:hypothetical protein
LKFMIFMTAVIDLETSISRVVDSTELTNSVKN